MKHPDGQAMLLSNQS